MKKGLLFSVLFIGLFALSSFKSANSYAKVSIVKAVPFPAAACEWKGKKLFGTVQFVTSGADLKIQYVDSYADINVQMVKSNPSSCGQWQEVSSGAVLKVQIVNSFPDLKVKLVTSNPGMK